MYPSFRKLKTIHLITAYKNNTNMDNYIQNGENFGSKNIFENYFINKKKSLFQIVNGISRALNYGI